MSQKRLYIKTYGCASNIYDSDRMVDILKPLGYRLTETPADADLVILNTCHIREKAEEKVYSDLGRIRDQKKDKALVAVAGCMAQAAGAEILERAPYVNMVVGTLSYHRLPEMIATAHRSADKRKGPGRGIVDVDFPVESKFDLLPAPTHAGPVAYLAIQEGCDKFCSFCVVPYTRGAEYSRPVAALMEEAKHLIAQGAVELMLLGQNVNAYHGEGPGGHEWGLGQLMEQLATLPGLLRIRYTTSHPRDMDEALMAAHRDIPQVMPHLHLPVQSGSDPILKAMNRKHTAQHYIELIEKTRKFRPDIALSSDFIVGFPGETEEHFQQTLNFVKEIQYSQSYSFKYSPRPGTPGALMENQIPLEVQAERLSRLQDLLNGQHVAFNQQSIGKTMTVLLDREGKQAGQLNGKTPHAQSVYVEAPAHLMGSCVDVTIEKATASSLTGRLVENRRHCEGA